MKKLIEKIFIKKILYFLLSLLLIFLISVIFINFFKPVVSKQRFLGSIIDETGNMITGTFTCYDSPVDRDCQTSCGPGIERTCTVDSRLTPIACGYYKEGKIKTTCEIEDQLFKVREAASFQNFICSFADKLYANTNSNNTGGGIREDGYLAWGSYNVDQNLCYSGSFYKVCCNPDGTVAPSVEYPYQDGLWPPEGWCGGKQWARTNYTEPSVGQPHPACKAGSITCTATSTSPGNLSVTANTTATSGEIEIRVESQTQRCNISSQSQSCTQIFNVSAGSVVAQASLIQNGQIVASTTCSASVAGFVPPLPSPPSKPSRGGICNPYIEIRAKKEGTSNWSSSGQNIDFNSTSSPPVVNKGDGIQIDVKISNNAINATAQCKYRKCIEYQLGFCAYNSDKTSCGWTCSYGDVLNNGSCGNCGGSAPICGCNKWSDEVYTEDITNPSSCELRGDPRIVTIGLNINDFRKFYNSNLSLNETFRVNPLSSISPNSISFDVNSIFKWASQLNPPANIEFTPQRHGYFYIKADKQSGNIYNYPDHITREDSNDKNYIACQECSWINNGWSCPWNNEDKSSYTIFDERNIFKDPLYVPYALLKVYIKPTEVNGSLNLGKPSISHPQVSTQKRDYIVGFSFPISYQLNPSGYWGKDKGSYQLKYSSPSGGGILTEGSGSTLPVSGTTNFTPDLAGNYSFSLCHKYDELSYSNNENNEAYRGGGEECVSQSITVYRYLCYQGFCWECSQEPGRLGGGRLDLRNCKTVEPAKCQAYINSDCKAKGRE